MPRMAGGTAGELESVRVTRILRDDIILGRRAPGSRLIERDIAAELEVSRLPVREAIRTLVNEGVVIARPRTWATARASSVLPTPAGPSTNSGLPNRSARKTAVAVAVSGR